MPYSRLKGYPQLSKICFTSRPRFFKEGWTLKPLAVTWGTQTVNRIDLTQKIRIFDVIVLIFTYIVT